MSHLWVSLKCRLLVSRSAGRGAGVWNPVRFCVGLKLPRKADAAGSRPRSEERGAPNLQDPGHQSQRAPGDPLGLFSLEQGGFNSAENLPSPLDSPTATLTT